MNFFFFLLMLLGALLSMKVNHDALSLDWNHQTRRFIKLSYFVFRWKRVIQYLHYWWTIPLRTDQIVKTSTLCSNSTAHRLASSECKNSLRGNGPLARSQFSFTDYHLPLMSHLPKTKQTHALLWREWTVNVQTLMHCLYYRRKKTFGYYQLCLYKHKLVHLLYYSTDGTLATVPVHTHAANSSQHSVVTSHMSQISNKTTVAQHSKALSVSPSNRPLQNRITV